MATNNFLTFAGGGSANVLSQSAYAALTTLLSDGFSSGIADSATVNKVIRQCAAIAYTVAKFIYDEGYDALDDGNSATLVANLKLALTKYISDSITGSLAANGWIKLPNELILQWGNANVTNNAYVTLPVAFTTTHYATFVSNQDTVNNIGASPYSLTQYQFVTASGSQDLHYFFSIGK